MAEQLDGAPVEEGADKPPQPTLRQRPFGRGGELVSELALGTWGLSGDAYGPVYHKEVERVIERAMELGITLFDTADVYGDGEMEKKLGSMLDAAIHRIVTKIGTFKGEDPPRKRFDPDSLGEAFAKSQERLQRDKLDVVLLHNPSLEALEQGDCVGWLRDRVEAGDIEHWGVSCGSPEVAKQAIKCCCDVIMVPYNVLHQKHLHGIADDVASTETAVMARSVLSHGLLAGHWPTTKIFFDNDHRSQRWSKEQLQFRRAQLAAVRQLVSGDIITLRGAAVRFVLANALVTSAVLGPRSVTQLNQLVREVGEGPPYLDEEALAELPQRLEAVGIETT